jgi:hypothetical protein
MSAGTMIACACKEIWMGKQSSLGPIDPQYRGLPAHAIIKEFKRAVTEIKTDQRLIPVWQPIIAKYTPALIKDIPIFHLYFTRNFDVKDIFSNILQTSG